MEIRNLETFLRVAELKSFTKAADDLGYAQSTVTFQIQQLEEELKLPLFERINKTITLTSAGKALIPHVLEMIDVKHKILQISHNEGMIPEIIRIGIPESLLTSYLIPNIETYCRRFPGVQLVIHAAGSPDLIEMLQQNNVDIAIVLGEKVINSHLVIDFSRTDTLVFVTSMDHDLAKEGTLTFSEVLDHPILITEKDSFYRQILENYASRMKKTLNPFIQSNNTSLLQELLHKKMGIAYLPRYLVEKDINNGILKELHVTDIPAHSMDILMIHHKNKLVTQQMEGLVSLFRETYA